MMAGASSRGSPLRAPFKRPPLILADETTGNLPSDKGEEILRILESLNRRGVTIVMSRTTRRRVCAPAGGYGSPTDDGP
jgi:ABC-type ATPase involved in cell division